MKNILKCLSYIILLITIVFISSCNGDSKVADETGAPMIELGRHGKGEYATPSIIILTYTDEKWRDIDSDIIINVEFGTKKNLTLPEFSYAVLEVIESNYDYSFNYDVIFPPEIKVNTGDYREETHILRTYRYDDYANIAEAERSYDTGSWEVTYTAPLKVNVTLTGREFNLLYGRLSFILWVYNTNGSIISYYTGANSIPFVISEDGIVLCGEGDYQSYRNRYTD